MSMSEHKRYFYVRDDLSMIIRSDGGTSLLVRAAEWVLGQYKNRQLALYATDMQCSVLQLAGRDTGLMRYTAYGWDRDEGASILRFTGQRKEKCSGHYILGNGYRAYQTNLMRFTAPDSMSPFGVGGLNAYCYCGNDPVNKVDPSGHTGLPPNAFLYESPLFTKRWGLRSAAAYAMGKKAPALKTLGVKKALAEIDPKFNFRARIKIAERNKSWQQKDVERLVNASSTLQGKANRFKAADEFFEIRGFFVEAQAAAQTRAEILVIKEWVVQKLVKAKEVLESRKASSVLQVTQVAEQVSNIRLNT
ncbi:RHS repeat-associated core domain-containing protein [Pseudomonas alabamensis]|uniref:RHS repeat-associated core domain-containing protein n=1 Tax=Pseudomonas alabamensis TaxID=3064349 RepID=UPI003F65283E